MKIIIESNNEHSSPPEKQERDINELKKNFDGTEEEWRRKL
jgi:hypothetical protein